MEKSAGEACLHPSGRNLGGRDEHIVSSRKKKKFYPQYKKKER
jgi:hypothetical protein